MLYSNSYAKSRNDWMNIHCYLKLSVSETEQISALSVNLAFSDFVSQVPISITYIPSLSPSWHEIL